VLCMIVGATWRAREGDVLIVETRSSCRVSGKSVGGDAASAAKPRDGEGNASTTARVRRATNCSRLLYNCDLLMDLRACARSEWRDKS
jgi:hypothetical protein